MGTPETCPLANPRSRLDAGHLAPGPLCVVSARRSWNAAPGQLLTGRSGAAAGWDLGGRDPLCPASSLERGPAGECAGSPGCVSSETWGLSRPSLVPLGSFVLRAERRGWPGGSRGWGWGCWSAAEVREAPGREKLALNHERCARILSHPEEQSGGFHSGLKEQTSALSALQTKVARGPESGASRTSLLAPTTAVLLFLPSPHPLPALRPS